LSKKTPEKTQELLAMLHEWQREMGAQMPRPNPEYKEKKTG
jgi:hypothetical protein